MVAHGIHQQPIHHSPIHLRPDLFIKQEHPIQQWCQVSIMCLCHLSKIQFSLSLRNLCELCEIPWMHRGLTASYLVLQPPANWVKGEWCHWLRRTAEERLRSYWKWLLGRNMAAQELISWGLLPEEYPIKWQYFVIVFFGYPTDLPVFCRGYCSL